MKLFLLKVLIALSILKPFYGTADVIIKNVSEAGESGNAENCGTIGGGCGNC